MNLYTLPLHQLEMAKAQEPPVTWVKLGGRIGASSSYVQSTLTLAHNADSRIKVENNILKLDPTFYFIALISISVGYNAESSDNQKVYLMPRYYDDASFSTPKNYTAKLKVFDRVNNSATISDYTTAIVLSPTTSPTARVYGYDFAVTYSGSSAPSYSARTSEIAIIPFK